MSQCCAQTAASTATGLVAAMVLVDVWTDVAMTRGKHTPHKYLTLGSIEYYKIYTDTKQLTSFAILD